MMTHDHKATGGRRGSTAYSVVRDPRGTYGDRGGYLAEMRSPLPFGLCQILNRRTADKETLPWVTLVLGSGCVQEGDGPHTGRTLARLVGEALAARPLDKDEASPATQAEEFAASLIEDRLGSLDVPVPSIGTDGQLHPAAASLVLTACLLTRVFYAAKSARPMAVSRWDRDEVRFHPEDPPREFDDVVRLLPPATAELRAALSELRKCRDDSGVDRAVMLLLQQVDQDLCSNNDGLRFSVQQLRLVTEIAWYYLLGDATAYPGWTDLLVRLMLRGDEPATAGSRRPRPGFLNLTLLYDCVSTLLEPWSEQSWNRRFGSTAVPARPESVYDAAATVLWAQHELAASNPGEPNRFPPSSAFVTSFDLELEMALWAQADGRPFSVAVPVHVLDNANDTEAELCWLFAEIKPSRHDRVLSALREPSGWRVAHREFNPRELREGPVIVHLSGCPLLTLPDLTQQDDPVVARLRRDLVAQRVTDALSDQVHMIHAVTVDEYLAVRQSEAELLWAGDDRAERQQRSLPPALVSDGTWHSRFWMVLGVPVADPAIRHRMTSQLTIGRFRGNASGAATTTGEESGLPAPPDEDRTPPQTRLNGVAVNKRIDDNEAAILHWLGLDVVSTDCERFTGDLFHYAKHVRGDKDEAPLRAPDPVGCRRWRAGDIR